MSNKNLNAAIIYRLDLKPVKSLLTQSPVHIASTQRKLAIMMTDTITSSVASPKASNIIIDKHENFLTNNRENIMEITLYLLYIYFLITYIYMDRLDNFLI